MDMNIIYRNLPPFLTTASRPHRSRYCWLSGVLVGSLIGSRDAGFLPWSSQRTASNTLHQCNRRSDEYQRPLAACRL
jgi:hypothetical protein